MPHAGEQKHRGNSATRPTSRAAIKGLQLEIEATALYLAGQNQHQIGQQLNVTQGAVSRAIKRSVKRAAKMSAIPGDELRQKHLMQLHELLLPYWNRALAGDGAALDRALRILDKIMDLEGIREDRGGPMVATQTNVTVEVATREARIAAMSDDDLLYTARRTLEQRQRRLFGDLARGSGTGEEGS